MLSIGKKPMSASCHDLELHITKLAAVKTLISLAVICLAPRTLASCLLHAFAGHEVQFLLILSSLVHNLLSTEKVFSWFIVHIIGFWLLCQHARTC